MLKWEPRTKVPQPFSFIGLPEARVAFQEACCGFDGR